MLSPLCRAIVTELAKLGAEVEEGRDYCVVHPPEAVKPGVSIDTYDDHRMVSKGRPLRRAFPLGAAVRGLRRRRDRAQRGHLLAYGLVRLRLSRSHLLDRPTGYVLLAGCLRRGARDHQRSRLHGEDLPDLLQRPGRAVRRCLRVLYRGENNAPV